MYISKCGHCGKEFESKYKRKCCSDSCKTMYYRKKNNPHQHKDKKCLTCGVSFRGTHSAKYCSTKCGLINKNCLKCNKEFKGHFNSKFCSMKCKDSYKQKKFTGEMEKCVVCLSEYPVTYIKKRNKKQVCSVRCGNVLATSKNGKIVTIEEIEDLVKHQSEQPTAGFIASLLNTSHTTILARSKEKYGSYREMIITVRGTYVVIEDDKSYSANTLFSLIDQYYEIQGIREKTFPNLYNPKTKTQLRVDYYIPNVPLAIEYHGIQHYQEVEFFDSKIKNSFKDRQFRDTIKEEFLLKNNIPLVIFNYRDELSLDLIKSRLDSYLNR